MSSKSIPVFRIKPKNKSNQITIKYVGTIEEDDNSMSDSIVELEKPLHPDYEIYGKHSIPIKRIGQYEFVGRIYRCNIIGDYLIKESTYPFIYLNIGYDRTFVSGSLLQVFISLELNPNEKDKIKIPKHYINCEFSGRWRVSIECDDELKKNYETLLSDKKDSVIRDLFKGSDYTMIKLANCVDYLINLCQSEEMHELLIVALKYRENDRRKQSHLDDDSQYIVSDQITHMNDIEKNLIDYNELIFE